MQAKTNREGFIHFIHASCIKLPHPVLQTVLVDGAHLFKQNNRIPGKACRGGISKICVGRFALDFWLVIAAAITVGLKRFPTSF